MGTLVGHVAPGFGFFLIGLWHLLNHIKLYSLHPNSYTSLPWFPTSKIRYLEPLLIMAGSFATVTTDYLTASAHHHPDATISEYSFIPMTLFVYASFSILLDRIRPTSQYGLTLFLGATAFAQQLLFFYLHSSPSHLGLEAQYHMLLQIVILVSLTTTLMGIGYPNSFMVSFVRSLSILFQGIWFMVLGFMIWTPSLIPKGCFMNLEGTHQVVRCHDDGALERAKSLVNIQFSWYLMGVTIFAVSLYLVLIKIYPEKFEYESLRKLEEEGGEPDDDVEARKKSKLGDLKSFVHMGKVFEPVEIER